MRLKSRTDSRARRHIRLRQTIKGTQQRPRMAVAISNKHMYVQFVDDVNARTLAAVSTLTIVLTVLLMGCAHLLRRRAERMRTA